MGRGEIEIPPSDWPLPTFGQSKVGPRRVDHPAKGIYFQIIRNCFVKKENLFAAVSDGGSLRGAPF